MADFVIEVILALEIGGFTSYKEVISWLKAWTASILMSGILNDRQDSPLGLCSDYLNISTLRLLVIILKRQKFYFIESLSQHGVTVSCSLNRIRREEVVHVTGKSASD